MIFSYILENLKPTKSMKELSRKGPNIRPNRMKVSANIPSKEALNAIKYKKKVKLNDYIVNG